jgi:hypothetical protein
MPCFEAGQRLDPNRTSQATGLAAVIGITACGAVKRSAMLRRYGPVPGMVRLALGHLDRAGTASLAGTLPGGRLARGFPAQRQTAGGHDR